MMDSKRFHDITGGFIAPVSIMEYDQHGRCVATFPHGGLTVLDQFAIGIAAELVDREGRIADGEWIASVSYSVAKAMLAKKREIEGV